MVWLRRNSAQFSGRANPRAHVVSVQDIFSLRFVRLPRSDGQRTANGKVVSSSTFIPPVLALGGAEEQSNRHSPWNRYRLRWEGREAQLISQKAAQ